MNISGKTALVVVDFQGGDLSDPMSTYVTEQVAKARLMVDECRRQGVPVVWIQEVHKPHLVDIGRELDGSEGPHCIEGNPATELASGLEPLPEEFHIRKRRYSSFFATELDIVLKAYDVDSLVLIGGFTDICILYTSVDAHQRDFFVNVVTDVVSGSSVRAHDDALKMIHYLQRDSLVTSDEVMTWLAELTPVTVP
ncbi:cysteine hydrolase [Kineosporia sp. J2-2]|uniref:Cysteine hydrolase n=1 Tax=Kineosporia corallincola TaxID=2835133 RepID=A0ABS5TGB0_9ACTN|nr:isochorismatase family cysteine hydrolase [Kineosporia corallincola]MBT0770080.1 cysteine hydrolase [Kineosporia corallincola]